MVRRPAALLRRALEGNGGSIAVVVPLVALAYFLVAPALPGLAAGDERTVVAGGVGLLMLAACALALVPARDTVYGPLFILLGAGLLMATLNASGCGAAANVPEALVAGAIGLLFARALGTPVVAVTIPLFVAAIDVWSVASGPTEQLLEGQHDRVDALSFDIPAWGHDGSVGALGLSDAVFVTMFAAWAFQFGLRRAPTLIALALSLVGSLVLSLALDTAVPALPLVAAAYLLPNLDRLARLFDEDADTA